MSPPFLHFDALTYEAIIAALAVYSILSTIGLFRAGLKEAKHATRLHEIVSAADKAVKDVLDAATQALIHTTLRAIRDVSKARAEAAKIRLAADSTLEEADKLLVDAGALIVNAEAMAEDEQNARAYSAARQAQEEAERHRDRHQGRISALGAAYGGPTVKAFRMSRDGNLTEVDPYSGFAMGGTLNQPNGKVRDRAPSISDLLALLSKGPPPRRGDEFAFSIPLRSGLTLDVGDDDSKVNTAPPAPPAPETKADLSIESLKKAQSPETYDQSPRAG